MNDETAPLQSIPVSPKYEWVKILILAYLPFVTRAIYALMNGRGIRGTFDAIWYGTNGPKPTAENSTARRVTLPLLCVAGVLLVSCATVRSVTVSITDVVHTSMQAYMDVKVAGHTSPDLDARVKIAHDKYREVAAEAWRTLQVYKSQASSGADPSAAVLETVRVAADGLLTVLEPVLERALVKKARTELLTAERIE